MFIEQTPNFIRAVFPKAIWRLPQKEKTVYITFDDGPIPEVTPWVLDILNKHGVKATFFCVGDNIRKHPDVYDMVVKAGHITGNHTFNHLQGFFTPNDEYIKNIGIADSYLHSNLLRPPHGQLRLTQTRMLKDKFRFVMWDVVTRDYNPKLDKEYVLNVVKKYTRNGSLIVFHDSLKAEKNLRYALPLAIEHLKQEGYRFGQITEDEIKLSERFLQEQKQTKK